MAIGDFLPRKEKDREEIEISTEEERKEEEKLKIKIDKLIKSEDVDKIIKFARQMVVIVKTHELQKRDFGYMQTLLEKLKRNCKQNRIDIVGTQDGYLILAPSFVEIVRE
ncbi:MAG: hypothetical protein QXD89_02400 [Candidatus Aenigmatarchaeota archaeon]